jgi:hypothetical protein
MSSFGSTPWRLHARDPLLVLDESGVAVLVAIMPAPGSAASHGEARAAAARVAALAVAGANALPVLVGLLEATAETLDGAEAFDLKALRIRILMALEEAKGG